LKLYKQQCRLTFYPEGYKPVDSLPDEVVSAPTISVFKRRLNDLWLVSGHGYKQRPIVPKLFFVAII